MYTRLLVLPFFLVLGGGCSTSPPDGVTPVTGFKIDRYLGKWYEVARLDHRFERGLSRVTAEYSVNNDGTIKVLNSGYNNTKNEWDSAQGKAKFRGDESMASLKVSFFGPFYGGYHIIDLDEDYKYALIAGPSRNFLWILARSPELDEVAYRRLVDKATALGFPTDKLIKVNQAGGNSNGE